MPEKAKKKKKVHDTSLFIHIFKTQLKHIQGIPT